MTDEMEPLGAEFTKVWDDNVDKLYISDDKALVERLRSGRWLGETTCGPAADRIEAQAAEIERLWEALGDLIEAVQRRTEYLGGYDGRFGLNKSIVKARAALGESHD